MKGKSELGRRTTNTYFAKRFSELIEEWKEKTGKTQKQFADDCSSNQNSIGNYKSGKSIPNDTTVLKMISVFNDAGMNVTFEDFIPDGGDRALYDPQMLRLLQDLNWEYAKEIGLSEEFLKFIFKYTGFNDPDEGYPVWSPMRERIVHSFTTQEEELKYLEGHDVAESYHYSMLETRAVSNGNNEFTARTNDGGSAITQTIDLHILKDLQDNIIDVIKYFYFKRRKTMRAQEIKATKLANPIIQKEGRTAIIGRHKFTKNELIEIDPYKKYLDWKNWKDEEE